MEVRTLGLFLLTNCFLGARASHHWIVTERGRISSQVENSGFPLTRHDDLLAFLEQEQRVNTVNVLYKQLMALKRSIDIQWSEVEGEGDLERRLYSTDIDCLLGKVPLSQHNLNTQFLDYGQGSRPKMKDDFQMVEPDCTAYSELDFSMRTFPHLETLNKRGNSNLTVEPAPSKTVFDYNIDAMLKKNSSDWTAYNIASLYWRAVGNGTNAVECARRAIYFSPRNERYIVLLNLGTLLQELHSLGEAAIVLHSAVDHDPVQEISHLALGNVYAAIGDYKRSLACYENVLSLDPGNARALQLKHALLCHKKLESGLLGIHSSLQNILQDLQKHNTMHEEWLLLQNQVIWERDSKIKEFFSMTQPLYLNLQMLLQNMGIQGKSSNEETNKKVPTRKRSGRRRKSTLDCNKDSKTSACAREKFSSEEEEEESELVNLVSPEQSVKTKMNSLMNFIKSNYKQEINLRNFKKKINKELNLMKERGPETQFQVDRSMVLNNLESCMADSNNVKKLN